MISRICSSTGLSSFTVCVECACMQRDSQRYLCNLSLHPLTIDVSMHQRVVANHAGNVWVAPHATFPWGPQAYRAVPLKILQLKFGRCLAGAQGCTTIYEAAECF